ncbi:MAG: hypothetical protein IKJ95_04265 [Bacteroidaceae bacterium]|nr:hypothetical protein [Bacteroidaceae bacterium]
MIIIALFLPLLSLPVSYIARYAPSSQKQNQSETAAKNEASYFKTSLKFRKTGLQSYKIAAYEESSSQK